MRIPGKKYFILALVILINLSFSINSEGTGAPGNGVKRESTRSVSAKQGRTREPRSVRKAKKRQEMKEKKLKKEYEEFVKENRKRSYEIQTDNVKERMKANRKATKINYREKSKKNSETGKKAGKKY